VRGSTVSLTDVCKRFNDTLAVDHVSLDIGAGEFVALLGPSGCGKTTLLRAVAGLARQTSGHVRINDVIVDALPPNQRGVGIVFQNYALFPHMTVAANVAFGLRAQHVPAVQRRETVRRMLELVRLEGMADRLPKQLSGGQQQRVALARTLAVQPRVLLLDEPFGALDKNLRLDMQIELKRLQRQLGITTIMVTHDQEEALSMADRIAVMSGGYVQQFDTPAGIYDRPLSRMVATFVGTANLFRARLFGGDAYFAEVHGLRAPVVLALPTAAPCSRAGEVLLSVRPEDLELVDSSHLDAPGVLPVRLRLSLPLGSSTAHELELVALDDDGPALASRTIKVVQARRMAPPWRFEPGDLAGVRLAAGARVAVFAPE
jgi:putative spermidine/putrescine transport system ATP-binding protein